MRGHCKWINCLYLAVLSSGASQGAPLSLGTGLDLNNDLVDDRYVISRLPDGTTGSFQAFVINYPVTPVAGGAWLPNDANSSWIAPVFVVPGVWTADDTFHYTTYFVVGFNPLHALINGAWAGVEQTMSPMLEEAVA